MIYVSLFIFLHHYFFLYFLNCFLFLSEVFYNRSSFYSAFFAVSFYLHISHLFVFTNMFFRNQNLLILFTLYNFLVLICYLHFLLTVVIYNICYLLYAICWTDIQGFIKLKYILAALSKEYNPSFINKSSNIKQVSKISLHRFQRSWGSKKLSSLMFFYRNGFFLSLSVDNDLIDTYYLYFLQKCVSYAVHQILIIYHNRIM